MSSKEQTWTLADANALLQPGRMLRIDATQGPCELWPLNVRHAGGDPASFVLQVREDGAVNVYDGEKLALEAVPALFVVMNGTVQLSMPESAEATCQLYDGTRLIEDGVTAKKASFVCSMGDPKFFQAKMGRIAFHITCHSPSQISLEIHYDRDGSPHAGLALEHRDGYVNVWRDIYSDGIWIPDRREKAGFFKYEIGKTYTFSMTVQIDEDGSPCIKACVSSLGGFKALTPCRCNSPSCEWISVRESYCGNAEPGKYDIEAL